MPLTDSQIKTLKPEKTAKRYADGGGLFLEVRPSGVKQFRQSVRWQGQQPTLTLGVYPAMKLAEARTARERVKAAIRAGNDPRLVLEVFSPAKPPPPPKLKCAAGSRKKADDAGPADLWRNIAKAYLAFRIRDGMHWKTRNKLERQVERTMEALGDKLVKDITSQDILVMVRPIEDAGHIETAHEVRSRCSQVFDFADGEGYPNSDPARKATKAMLRRRRGKFPGTTEPRAVGRMMRAIRRYERVEPQVRIGLLLSAYLFPRSDQLRGMLWSEIDVDSALWEIPGARMKGAEAPDQLVPLPRQALDLLQEAATLSDGRGLVLPSPRGTGKKLSDMTFNMALRRIGFDTKTQHCHHGFRTTASTNLNELGFNRDWIERQLAHIDQDAVRRGYNKAQYLQGRVEMMQTYANWLDDLEASG